MSATSQNTEKKRISLRFGARDGSAFLLDKSKKFNFAIRHFQKKINSTIDPLSLGIYAPGSQVLTYRPQILRGVRI